MSCTTLPFCIYFFFFKQKTAYEMRISDWSSDVCSSDLARLPVVVAVPAADQRLRDDLHRRRLQSLAVHPRRPRLVLRRVPLLVLPAVEPHALAPAEVPAPRPRRCRAVAVVLLHGGHRPPGAHVPLRARVLRHRTALL